SPTAGRRPVGTAGTARMDYRRSERTSLRRGWLGPCTSSSRHKRASKALTRKTGAWDGKVALLSQRTGARPGRLSAILSAGAGAPVNRGERLGNNYPVYAPKKLVPRSNRPLCVVDRNIFYTFKSRTCKTFMSASNFAAVPLAPRDPILGLTEAFIADERPDKVNLGVDRKSTRLNSSHVKIWYAVF